MNPDLPNDYDPGEIAIVRAYFGLEPLASLPAIDQFYLQSTDEEQDSLPPIRPVRLRHIGSEQIDDVSAAVARICLSSIQDRLPQWALMADAGEVLGRHPFEQPDGHRMPLEPEHLLCINWADSGPGYSWPEDYYVTCMRGFGRFVVTASSDSPDSYGVTDWAIGWFDISEEIEVGATRVICDWWRQLRDRDQRAWAYLFSAGWIDEAAAEAMRKEVWPEAADDDEQ